MIFVLIVAEKYCSKIVFFCYLDKKDSVGDTTKCTVHIQEEGCEDIRTEENGRTTTNEKRRSKKGSYVVLSECTESSE